MIAAGPSACQHYAGPGFADGRCRLRAKDLTERFGLQAILQQGENVKWSSWFRRPAHARYENRLRPQAKSETRDRTIVPLGRTVRQ